MKEIDELMKRSIDDEEDKNLFNYSLYTYRNIITDKDRESLNQEYFQ